MRPELLAVRATNQYRTRDILAYLGLRYYFANQCARRDRWAEEVSFHLVKTRCSGSYFRSLHFKELQLDGGVLHRDMFLPGPNEAFAEAALLAECSRHAAFRSHEFVFSYRLSEGEDSQGVYKPYFSGLKERHEKIAVACNADQSQVVLYTDIKKFYPNILGEFAYKAWDSACDAAQIAAPFRELGVKLLADHALACRSASHGKGLLTGPMFSHLIANLVLSGVDKVMSTNFPRRYFRYVDDVVIVGSDAEVSAGRKQLAELLRELQLDLHAIDANKDFSLVASDWLAGKSDLAGEDSKDWMEFVGKLKQILVSYAPSHDRLAGMFAQEGFRIPLTDYSVEVSDARYLDRLLERLKRYPWLPKKMIQVTPSTILEKAQSLRSKYTEGLNEILSNSTAFEGYERKRVISKARFFAGRLLYLARPEELSLIAERLGQYPELAMLGVVHNAVGTRDVTSLLPMGVNAAQSAAQTLKLNTGEIRCRIESFGVAERQGLAVLRANGISVTGPTDDELNRFAVWNESGHALMTTGDSFIQEISCLHGVSKHPRHPAILKTAFDQDEELAFDATTPIDTY